MERDLVYFLSLGGLQAVREIEEYAKERGIKLEGERLIQKCFNAALKKRRVSYS